MSEQAVFDFLKYCVEVDADGTQRHYNSAGKLHRTEGPAVEYHNGGKEWWQNNRRHRIDGPAIEYKSGHKEWWLNGTYMTEDEFNQAVKQNV